MNGKCSDISHNTVYILWKNKVRFLFKYTFSTYVDSNIFQVRGKYL